MTPRSARERTDVAGDYRWWVYWPVHLFYRLVARPVDLVERVHSRQAEARWFDARSRGRRTR